MLVLSVLSGQGQLTFMAARSPDSETIELDREYLDTVTVQGREYQKYSIDHRTYFGPVDEVSRPDLCRGLLTDRLNQEEAQRLEDQQQVFQRIFDNRLIFPPIHRLKRVLDCGHGSASWAVDVAEQNPDCEVRCPLDCARRHPNIWCFIGHRRRHCPSHESRRHA